MEYHGLVVVRLRTLQEVSHELGCTPIIARDFGFLFLYIGTYSLRKKRYAETSPDITRSLHVSVQMMFTIDMKFTGRIKVHTSALICIVVPRHNQNPLSALVARQRTHAS